MRRHFRRAAFGLSHSGANDISNNDHQQQRSANTALVDADLSHARDMRRLCRYERRCDRLHLVRWRQHLHGRRYLVSSQLACYQSMLILQQQQSGATNGYQQ
jgi:hypothetical protein